MEEKLEENLYFRLTKAKTQDKFYKKKVANVRNMDGCKMKQNNKKTFANLNKYTMRCQMFKMKIDYLITINH